jgi:hypothetical protein
MDFSTAALSQDSSIASLEALHRPMTDQEASEFLGVAVLTLYGWRHESRKRKRLLGPAWINLAVDDGKEIVRYRLIDLVAWLDSRRSGLVPARRPGRPKKLPAEAAASV